MAASSSAKIQAFLGASRFAVVGASADRGKFGNKVLRCYLQHGRAAVPVNPKESRIEGQPCAASLGALGGDVKDLAVSVITPPKVTVGVLEEAAKLGISRLWLQPGCEDGAVLAKARELGLEAGMISGGPCLLVQLGYDDSYRPPGAAL